ncbi:hypothetical protein EHI8A_016900 [Entamoeba histolytica HM-1:IMSS-B]|uniref:C2 NT-type domain-containing protein n=6 Tax=Entamoeba histolytica TaxID=5759 RepID=C4M8U8_ENTH1|nr:hypothetical protein EHI_169670 [Entamoeba histolytica HM-1:IMSS]EMD44150.1 GRIP domain containing protein RUD3 [Entamoeba histolytica KU27]EMH76472.1 hypothetical protein EHI8A_016900 [Entamoeba histolytica HM-1:IMSS-B]EMS13602.1 GRIP domain containing protein RUD3 [Entamoeba histolytica HM-3:IMSS]ENY59786.1 GRIP domain containing protein RUD3 [Entamoeba histolytica HM-1:IMSS-A]GAT98051.1 hypothetical protein CL6EHI_169670 [Entamoeba histolytica]|eukprot:XP_650383.1 hypothetical protein EHI_169670 [Entamoeba histolytica HM-1:IMSS]
MKSLLKKNIKQDYTIEFKQISGIGVPEGTEVILKWRRGEKKENKGSIEKAQVHGSNVLYSPVQTVNIHCTLFLTKNGYEEKGLEVSLHSIGKKGKELCKGYVDLAHYADLNGVGKDISLPLKGKVPATVDMKITSLIGEAGGSSDETEVLHMNQSSNIAATTDIHELLVQQVDKKNHEIKKEEKIEKEENEAEESKKDNIDEEKEEEELVEKQRKQKEIQEQEEAARQKQLEEQQKEAATSSDKSKEKTDKAKEKSLFAASMSDVKIKGKKDKDKKKFKQEDIDKAVEQALAEKKQKHHKKVAALKAQIEALKAEKDKEIEDAVKEKDIQIEELNKKVQEETKEKEEAKASLAISVAAEATLKAEVEKKDQELKNKGEELEKEKEEQAKKIEEIQKEKEEQTKKVEELEGEKNNEKQKVEELEKKVNDSEKENNELKGQLKDLQKKLEETEKNAAAGSEELLKQKNEEIDNIKKEKEVLSKENKQLKEQISSAEENSNSIIENEKKEKEDLKHQNEELKQQIEELKEENNKKERELAEKEVVIVSLQKSSEEVNKKDKSSSSSSDEEENEKKENGKLIKKLMIRYSKYNNKYENNIPSLANEIKVLLKGNNEIIELDHLKSVGDNTFDNALYMLLTFANLSNNYIVKKVERDGSLNTQLLDLEYFFFIKVIVASTMKLNGFLESMMKDNQCFERRKAAEFEQVTAGYVPKYLSDILNKLESMGIKEELVQQLMKQIVSYIAIHVIELLIENDKLVNCAKGLQLKFFFSIMEAEMSDIKKLSPYRKYIQPAIEVSGLLVLDHSADKFDYQGLKQTLPHLTGSTIYAILSRFKSDNLNHQSIDQSILSKIEKDDAPFPSALDLIE